MNHGLYSCASRLRGKALKAPPPQFWGARKLEKSQKEGRDESRPYSELPAPQNWGGGAFLLLAFFLFGFALPAARADTPDSLFAAGKFEPARAGYTAAVLAAPNDPAPHIGLVRALLRLDHWADAVTEARAATLQFPQNADLHGLFALALIRAGWQPPCVDEAKQALTLDANNYWGLVASGRLADWDGKEEETRADFRKAATAHPELPDAWLGLISVLDDVREAQEDDAATAAYLKLNPLGHPHDELVPDLRDVSGDAAYQKAFKANPPFQRVSSAQTDTGATTLKVEFSRDYAVFPVTINDKKFRLLFDTGGGDGIALAKNPVRRLSLTPLVHGYIRGGGGRERSDVLKADTLTLGDLHYKSILIHTMRDTVAGADGILSGSVLSDSVVTLDYTNGTAALTHSAQAAAPSPLPGDAVVAVPFHIYEGHLFAHLALNTVPVWAMLDTGDEQTILSLSLAKDQLKSVSKEDFHTGTYKGRLGVGDDTRMEYIYSPDESDITLSQSPLITISTKTIGESVLDRHVSPSYDFEIGMLLGVSTLTSARRVTFDYPHHLMTFEYVIPPPPPVPAEKKPKK